MLKKLIVSTGLVLLSSNALSGSISLTTDPLYLIAGGVSLEGGFSLADNLEPFVGGHSLSFDYRDIKIEVAGADAGITWYKSNILNDSFYLKARAGYKEGKLTNDYNESINFESKEIAGIMGYQWKWDSGFNMKLGVGIQRTEFNNDLDLADSSFKNYDSFVGTSPTIEFKTGFYI